MNRCFVLKFPVYFVDVSYMKKKDFHQLYIF